MTARLLILLAAVLAEPVLAARARAPNSAVTVLVDLSATWHNDASHQRNRKLLQAIGTAIVNSQARMPKPMQVSYRIIGSNSLSRDGFYQLNFAPTLMGRTTPDTAAQLPVFTQRLSGPPRGWTAANGPTALDPVPLTMLRLPPEQRTEIMGAVIAARRADALLDRDAPKRMIILSDFVEDSQGEYRLTDSLRGYRIWLIGRVLPTDSRQSDALQQRMAAFRKSLQARGASVQSIEESAVLASPMALALKL